jgi:hypothetical protein
VVAGLTVGIAVLAFGSATRSPPQLTASGTMQPLDQGAGIEAAGPAPRAAEPGVTNVLFETNPVPSIVGNPALVMAPNAGENLKLRPVKETKKAKKARNLRAAGEADAVRLPPSGL